MYIFIAWNWFSPAFTSKDFELVSTGQLIKLTPPPSPQIWNLLSLISAHILSVLTDNCDDRKVIFEDTDPGVSLRDTSSHFNCDMCGDSFESMDQFMDHRNTYCLAVGMYNISSIII